MPSPTHYPDGCYGPPDADGPCDHCAEASRPVREACAEGGEHCTECHFAIAEDGSCAEWCNENQMGVAS